jgi:hypothetical protein
MNWRTTTGAVLVGAGLLVLVFWFSRVYHQAPASDAASKTTLKTNASPNALRAGAKTGPGVPGPGAPRPGLRPGPGGATPPGQVLPARPNTKGGPGTNALALRTQTNATTNSAFAETLHRLQNHPAFYPALALIPLCIGAILLLVSFKPKSKQAAPATGLETKTIARPLVRKGGKTNVHGCNVLLVRPDARQVWQFSARAGTFELSREQTSYPGEPLPGKLIEKDWRSLWQPKLNIAWLPPESVFLRVAQFPRSAFTETVSMVEFQLEKLSPIPVPQIVWSIQVLPHAKENMQTVIVLIVARSVVEEFLGQLEGEGFLADRLELPMVDQLQATSIKGDGVWIYPAVAGGNSTAMAAWWYGGVLQNLDILNLPPTDRPAALKEQLVQMAWAGELEGWLTSPPTWHLVADATTAEDWGSALRTGMEQPVELITPRTPTELAALTATRAAQTEPQTNLLPVEFSTRYQQQFVDRLWMRALGATVALYLVGVSIYGIAVGFFAFRTRAVEQQVADLGPTYTNALQLKAQFQVLKDRQELKYAALDCWKAVAELLPESATLEGLNFGDGKKLSVNGTAPSDQALQLTQFEGAMRKYAVNSQPLFDQTKGDTISMNPNPGAGTLRWGFTLELKRVEVQ